LGTTSVLDEWQNDPMLR